MSAKLAAALMYASWGWPVLPVQPNGKAPANQNGVNGATTDPGVIKQWWGHNPDYNIGVAAGERSGIIVFDVDPRNGGETSWHKWIDECGALVVDYPLQLTAGGGEHFIAQYQPGVRSCKLRDGVDLLADGRYFLASPSSINGATYEWEGSSDPADGIAPFTIPAKWLEAMSARAVTTGNKQVTNNLLPTGSRNSGLTALGGSMRHFGMSEAEIYAALAIANETRCDPPVPSSELSQIVRSVCRYEPDYDAAGDAARGEEAANALLMRDLERVESNSAKSAYHFIDADTFFDEPSPLRWAVRDWVPEQATTMIFGESGCGKTFVAMSMACCIATGTPWAGHAVQQGRVAYLAGEGNYGLRQRVAAWGYANNMRTGGNLLISSGPIDIDNNSAAPVVIKAVRDLADGDFAAIFIDTVNAHLAGDENSSKEARAMLNNCGVISRALNATVILVHHIGVAAEAKNRARGSSAWKAALDSSILVVRADDGVMELTSVKMKDAQQPAPVRGILQPVPLPWRDDSGEQVIGAVFAPAAAWGGPSCGGDGEPKRKTKAEQQLQRDKKRFEAAWVVSGRQVVDNLPFVSQDGMLGYLTTDEALSEMSAKNYIKPAGGKIISVLLDNCIIERRESGWVVIDPGMSSALMLLQRGR